MNRPIKFRAWAVGRNKMYFPTAINGETGKALDLWYGYEIQGENDDILMQSTGLFANDGVEIFEGDIIEYTQCLFNTDPKQWPRKTKTVEWNAFKGAWNVYSTAAGELDIIVIGNVFQNTGKLS
jgi:hypothetical protein